MKRLRTWLIVAVVVITALVGFQYCRSRGQDANAGRHVETSKDIDKQHEAQTAASARVDTVVDTLWLGEKKHVASEASHAAREDSLRRVADTAGQHAATLRDTAQMWHLRWQLRGVALLSADSARKESDSARVAADLRADSLKLDRNRWKGLATSAVASQDSLRDDLRVARTGCRVLPFVPCLSRKQTLVLGAAAGAAAARYIEEQRRKKDRASPRAAAAVGAQLTVLRF